MNFKPESRPKKSAVFGALALVAVLVIGAFFAAPGAKRFVIPDSDSGNFYIEKLRAAFSSGALAGLRLPPSPGPKWSVPKPGRLSPSWSLAGLRLPPSPDPKWSVPKPGRLSLSFSV
jgi:hypothetical protein